MTQREDFEAWWGEFSSAHEDWKYADSAALRWAAWQAAQAAQPARQVPTTNYVQPVPDHCDRITWRNRYYHLPLAAPTPPVREPLSDNTIAALRQAIAQPATTEWTVIAPDGTRFTGPTPLKAALPASKYRLEIDPVAAVKFMEIIDQEAEKGRQEAEQCMRDYGTLDCPACGGSGHIGDVKQPAQVPAGSIRLWDTQWASIVNHDNAYNGWSTNDAVNHAVRMTERYIAANVAQNNLPPLPAAPEVK